MFSCGTNNTGKEQNENAQAAVNKDTVAAQPPKINVDSIVSKIDNERERIEVNLKSLKRTTLSTKDLRPQIKQKWSKIDFYTENGKIVRIKSYPYGQIAKRTEEFYFNSNKLILAFIEDEGLKNTGKSEKRVGKTYFFFNDACIKEDNRTNEKETSIRNSDSERLMQESGEYLDLFPKK